MKNKNNVQNLTLSAMMIAMGLVLPMITGQMQAVGNMLLPMHLPVFLAGLLCGWQYGLLTGLIVPLLRSVLFGMPPLYPVAIAMMFELAVYGAVSGFLYERSPWKCVIAVYKALIAAMIAGRIVWGIAEVILLSLNGKAFTMQAFLAGAFLNAIPGIVIQLIIIPAIMVALNRAGLVKFGKKGSAEHAAV